MICAKIPLIFKIHRNQRSGKDFIVCRETLLWSIVLMDPYSKDFNNTKEYNLNQPFIKR